MGIENIHMPNVRTGRLVDACICEIDDCRHTLIAYAIIVIPTRGVIVLASFFQCALVIQAIMIIITGWIIVLAA
jgi:hypothetical protein